MDSTGALVSYCINWAKADRWCSDMLSVYRTWQAQHPVGLQWPALQPLNGKTLILSDTPKHTQSDSMWHQVQWVITRTPLFLTKPSTHCTNTVVWPCAHGWTNKNNNNEETAGGGNHIVSLLKRKHGRRGNREWQRHPQRNREQIYKLK